MHTLKALVIGPLVPDFDMGYKRAATCAREQFGYRTETLEFYVTTLPGQHDHLMIDMPKLARGAHTCAHRINRILPSTGLPAGKPVAS